MQCASMRDQETTESQREPVSRRGKGGEPRFYAGENGDTVHPASPVTSNAWPVTEAIRDRHYCVGCDGGCMNQAMACKQWQRREAGKGKS